MARTKLNAVLRHFEKTVSSAERLVDAALRSPAPGAKPRLAPSHQHQIVELGFLQSYLGWEAFLEESFVLYLLGKSSPAGFQPQRYALPVSRQHALTFMLGDNRHTDWTAADRVVARAKRYFRDGRPYEGSLRPRTHLFNDLKTVRNAIAHASEECDSKFHSLVRRELGYVPRNTSVGRFLMFLRPAGPAGATYMSFYIDELRAVARLIVPCL